MALMHHVDAGSEKRLLDSPAELIDALQTKFLLDVSGLHGLESALGRLW